MLLLPVFAVSQEINFKLIDTEISTDSIFGVTDSMNCEVLKMHIQTAKKAIDYYSKYPEIDTEKLIFWEKRYQFLIEKK